MVAIAAANENILRQSILALRAAGASTVALEWSPQEGILAHADIPEAQASIAIPSRGITAPTAMPIWIDIPSIAAHITDRRRITTLSYDDNGMLIISPTGGTPVSIPARAADRNVQTHPLAQHAEIKTHEFLDNLSAVLKFAADRYDDRPIRYIHLAIWDAQCTLTATDGFALARAIMPAQHEPGFKLDIALPQSAAILLCRIGQPGTWLSRIEKTANGWAINFHNCWITSSPPEPVAYPDAACIIPSPETATTTWLISGKTLGNAIAYAAKIPSRDGAIHLSQSPDRALIITAGPPGQQVRIFLPMRRAHGDPQGRAVLHAKYASAAFCHPADTEIRLYGPMQPIAISYAWPGPEQMTVVIAQMAEDEEAVRCKRTCG